MIWFFLMGMIAGAVGMVMLSRWWIDRHVRFYEPTDEENEKMKKEPEEERHD